MWQELGRTRKVVQDGTWVTMQARVGADTVQQALGQGKPNGR